MRIDQITFTRFIAAMAIVIYHYGREVFPFNQEFVLPLFNHANIGVSYFFILSGFVMIIAYGNKEKINIFEYLRSRFARIYPVYLLAIILVLFFTISNKIETDFSGLLLNLFTLQAWIPGKVSSINAPGWSLSVEFFFYAIFPLVFNYIYSKINSNKLIVPIILIWISSQIALHLAISSHFYGGFPSKSHDLIFYFPIMHLNEFLIGNLAGLIFINRLKFIKFNMNILLLLLLTILLIIALKYPIGLNYHNGLLALIFVPMILLLSMNNGLLSKILNLKILVFLGEISYGIYILQYPVYLWTNNLLKYFHIENQVIQFYVFLSFLIVVSVLSYLFIEKPLRNRIKKHTKVAFPSNL